MLVGNFSELLFESVICCNNYAYFRLIMEKQSDRPTRVTSVIQRDVTILNNVMFLSIVRQMYMKFNLKISLSFFLFSFGRYVICRSIYEFWLLLSILKLFLQVKKLKISSTFIDVFDLLSDILHSLMNMHDTILYLRKFGVFTTQYVMTDRTFLPP